MTTLTLNDSQLATLCLALGELRASLDCNSLDLPATIHAQQAVNHEAIVAMIDAQLGPCHAENVHLAIRETATSLPDGRPIL